MSLMYVIYMQGHFNNTVMLFQITCISVACLVFQLSKM
jgi:hypothetical protein